ncbi:hypothetical protein Hanom_Chr10g00929361 [Helianthus anomalus]
MTWFLFWTKMVIKVKPQGPRCKKFEFWTKVTKVTKPRGLKWQFTLYLLLTLICKRTTDVCIGVGPFFSLFIVLISGYGFGSGIFNGPK